MWWCEEVFFNAAVLTPDIRTVGKKSHLIKDPQKPQSYYSMVWL